MSFETLETITKDNMPPVAKISYMPPLGRASKTGKPKLSKDTKPQLIISIPTTVCGTAKAKNFILQLGSGTNLGKLRIKGSADKEQGIVPKELQHCFMFRFGFVPRLGEEHFDGEHRPLRKIGVDEFEIDVPTSWFTQEKGKP